mmetsp:Transcript_28394/g.93202  ORF Transcript_28394/g.93202 Transcript_28394/m.93202 type:complete len:301 (-) Transcript_28394:35-937(-)
MQIAMERLDVGAPALDVRTAALDVDAARAGGGAAAGRTGCRSERQHRRVLRRRPVLERARERLRGLKHARSLGAAAHLFRAERLVKDGVEDEREAAGGGAGGEAGAADHPALPHQGIALAERARRKQPGHERVANHVGELGGRHLVGDEAIVLLERLAQLLFGHARHLVDHAPDQLVEPLRLLHRRLALIERHLEGVGERRLIGPAQPLHALEGAGPGGLGGARHVVEVHVEAVVPLRAHLDAAADLALTDAAAAALAGRAAGGRVVEPELVRDGGVVAAVGHDQDRRRRSRRPWMRWLR